MLANKPFFVSSLEPETIEEYFSGIATLKDCMFIDSEGLREYKQANQLKHIDQSSLDEGRFIAFMSYWSGYICKSDAFGQEPIFYYNEGSVWAISNSFVYLAEKLRSHKISLTTYEAAFRSFLVSNQSLFGGQLLSHSTPILQIKMLPYNKQIRLRKSISSFKFKIESRKQRIPTIKSVQDYEYWLRHYMDSWQSRMDNLVQANFSSKLIELSGGYDSRVNFSLICDSDKVKNSIGISSIKFLQDDYRVAKDIASQYGFRIGNVDPVKPIGVSAEKQYHAWKYGCAGFYAPMYTIQSPSHVDKLKIHGANYRGRSYVKHPANKRLEVMLRDLPENFREEVEAEYRNSFRELGTDIEAPGAIDEHYLAFRCRLHYGRNWFWRFRDFYITPQLSPLYKALSDWRYQQTSNPEQTTCDVLFSQNKQLAQMPFDVPEKSFSQETIERSGKLRLPKHEHHEVKVYGQPSNNSSPQRDEGRSTTRKQAIEEFKQEIKLRHNDAMNSSEVKRILGNDFIKASKQQSDLERLPSSGKVSTVMAAHIISELTDRSGS